MNENTDFTEGGMRRYLTPIVIDRIKAKCEEMKKKVQEIAEMEAEVGNAYEGAAADEFRKVLPQAMNQISGASKKIIDKITDAYNYSEQKYAEKDQTEASNIPNAQKRNYLFVISFFL